MRNRMTAVMAFMLALCLVLVGCGGGDESSNADGGGTKTGASASNTEKVVPAAAGVWEFDSIIDEDEGEMSSDDIEDMKAMGFNVFLVLNEDGSAVMNLFGTDLGEGTWAATSGTEGTVAFGDDDEDSSVPYKIEDDRLTLSYEGESMRFARSTQEDFESYMDEKEEEAKDDEVDEADASTETASVTGGIDNDIITFTVNEVYVDSSNDLMVRYSITNKTDKNIVFTDESGDFKVNGKDADITCITRMEPGETVEDDFLYFSNGGDLVDDINKVTFSGVFEVHDSDYNVLGTYDFTL